MRAIQSAFTVALVVVTSAAAAVLSHVAIDALGDVLLARDAYDHVQHHSRAIFAGLALLVAGVLVLCWLLEALGRRNGSVVSFLRRLKSEIGTSPWAFAAIVIAVSFAGLVGMEFLDCRIDGVQIGGFANLVGGSIALGCAATALFGSLLGCAAHALVRILAAWEPRMAARLVALLSPKSRNCLDACRRLDVGDAARACGLLPARNVSKRGPPLAAPA
jgi:hypothetical protein